MSGQIPIEKCALGVGAGNRAQDDAALNIAIARANNLGGNVRITYPPGSYKHSNISTPILAPRVSVVGATKESTYLDLSAANGTFLQWGDPSLPTTSAGIESSFEGFTVDWGQGPSGSVFGRIANYHQVEFRNNRFRNFQTLLSLGESAVKTASMVKVLGCSGFSANGGSPAFRLRYGAGFNMGASCNFFVNVPPPSPGGGMATLPGTNLINCEDGSWDACQIDGGIYERWYIAFAITAHAGSVYQDFFVTNAVCDYNRFSSVFLESKAGGTITGMAFLGGWMVSWEHHNIQIIGDGINDDNSFCHIQMPYAGHSYLSYSNATAHSNLFADNRLQGDNVSGNAAAGIHYVSGTGLRAHHNYGTSRALTGIVVGPACDECTIVDNRVKGTASYIQAPAATSTRDIANNG